MIDGFVLNIEVVAPLPPPLAGPWNTGMASPDFRACYFCQFPTLHRLKMPE